MNSRIGGREEAGRAGLLASVGLDEILALSDRIAVMFDGRIMGERRPDEATAGDLGGLMAGVDPGVAPPEAAIPPAAAPGAAPEGVA